MKREQDRVGGKGCWTAFCAWLAIHSFVLVKERERDKLAS